MNHNLPKPMLDALARQTLPMDHPSADALTAFTENALRGDEHRRIADHLAACGGCREIVFLSASAADEPLQVEEQIAAEIGARRRWMPWLVWGSSVATAVLVGASALMLWQNRSAPSSMQMASRSVSVPAAQPSEQTQEPQRTTEAQSAAEPPTITETPTARPLEEPQGKTARAKTSSPRDAETLGVGSSAGIVAGALPAPAKAAPATTIEFAKTGPKATNEDSRSLAGAKATAAMPSATAPYVNSFAAVQGGPAGAVPGSTDRLLLNPQTTLHSVRAVHPQWRITPDGHLEHLTDGGWTRILADHSAEFRVVSVVGNHVWVGGTGGALFHSRDDGQNWEEVALTALPAHETATIVSIQFDDPKDGTITTDSGTRCITIDGGGNWSCH